MILLHLEARNRHSIPGLPRVRDPEGHAAQLSALLFHTIPSEKSADLGLPHSTVEKLTPSGDRRAQWLDFLLLQAEIYSFLHGPVSIPGAPPTTSVSLPHSGPSRDLRHLITCPRGGSSPGWEFLGWLSFPSPHFSYLPVMLQAVPISYPVWKDHSQTLQMEAKNHSAEQVSKNNPDFASRRSRTGQTPQRSWGTDGETDLLCPGPPTQGRTRNRIQVSSPQA